MYVATRASILKGVSAAVALGLCAAAAGQPSGSSASDESIDLTFEHGLQAASAQSTEEAPDVNHTASLGADATVAGELVPPEEAEQLALRPDERSDPFNFYAGVDFVSKYISRGQVFSSKASVQPWVEFDIPIGSGRRIGPFDSVSWFVGNWNSIQGGSPGVGQSRSGNSRVLDNWYEADFYSGLRVKFAEHFGGSLRFNYYTSPSESFRDIQEIDFRLSYDDSRLWKSDESERARRFSLNPSLRVTKEINDGGGPEGLYVQPALRPSWTFDNLPVKLTVQTPLVLGFGAQGQYRDAEGDEIHFGFFQTGVGAQIPLDVLPEGGGSLHLSAAVDVIFVTDPDINFRGETMETVAKIGLTYAH